MDTSEQSRTGVSKLNRVRSGNRNLPSYMVTFYPKAGAPYMAKQDSYDGSLHHKDEVGYKMAGDDVYDSYWFSSWTNMMAFKDPAFEAQYNNRYIPSEKTKKTLKKRHGRNRKKRSNNTGLYKVKNEDLSKNEIPSESSPVLVSPPTDPTPAEMAVSGA